MTTLYGYILRELLKTMLLAVTAMTVLFTMGGGLYNIIRFEGVSAGDVLTVIPLLVPIVVTMSLPVAALFAATMVYGRLAADNELTACRAAGINVHRLFLPAFLLSIFVSLFVLVLGNFVIPGFIQHITDFARNNLRDLVAQGLQKEGFLYHRDKSGGVTYTLTAERVQGVADADLQAKGFETGPGLQYLHVSSPTFLQVDGNGRLLRFTVARDGLCLFDVRPNPIQVTVLAHQARDFEVGKNATFVEQQQLGPINVPLPSPFRLSTADLRSLMRWMYAPWEVPKLGEQIADYTRGLTRLRLYEHAVRQMSDGGTLVLRGPDRNEYRIAGRKAAIEQRSVRLLDARVSVARDAADLPTRYEAPEAELRAEPADNGQYYVDVVLTRAGERDVLENTPRGGRYGDPQRKPSVRFEALKPPAEVIAAVAALTPSQIIDRGYDISGDTTLNQKRLTLQASAGDWVRKITGTMHFRLGYSSCALATVLMGAALGVCFRGARALSAFALAMIPLFSVLMMMVVGRQLSEESATALVGPFVIWASLALALVADGFIIRLGVRR